MHWSQTERESWSRNFTLQVLGHPRISLAKLRTAAIPKLGNMLEASWDSVDGALAAQNAPFRLKESTATFQRTKGGLMLNILNAPAGPK